MRKGTVFLFVVAVVSIYSWADFGSPPLEVKLSRLYFITPGIFCGLFGFVFYQISTLQKQLERLRERFSELEASTADQRLQRKFDGNP
jgi:hypothetical protein